MARCWRYYWLTTRIVQMLENRQTIKAGEEAKQQRQEVVAAVKKKQEAREAKGGKEVRIEPVMKKSGNLRAHG